MSIRDRIIPLAMALICLLLTQSGCDEGRSVEISRDLEQSRITSPNGLLDAVLVREDGGGAPGGWEWYVYIVSKGSAVSTGPGATFNAGTLKGCTLTWGGPYLLNVGYDIALINQFSNLWDASALRHSGKVSEQDRVLIGREYLVEIRLMPSSPDYSLLTPAGSFKPR
jgi:hypothetical protein